MMSYSPCVNNNTLLWTFCQSYPLLSYINLIHSFTVFKLFVVFLYFITLQSSAFDFITLYYHLLTPVLLEFQTLISRRNHLRHNCENRQTIYRRHCQNRTTITPYKIHHYADAMSNVFNANNVAKCFTRWQQVTCYSLTAVILINN